MWEEVATSTSEKKINKKIEVKGLFYHFWIHCETRKKSDDQRVEKKNKTKHLDENWSNLAEI